MKDPAREERVSALLVGDYETDRLLVHDVFRGLGWRLFEARDRRQAVECLDKNPIQVVMAGTQMPGWSWKSVLRDLRLLPKTPQLVVTSRTADDSLWAEALNLGAFDVLAEPFDRDELTRVIASASRRFESRPAGRVRAASSQVA